MTQQGIELNPIANAVLPEDTNEGSDPIARKALMLDTYTEAIGDEKNENTQRCINEALRGTILPKKSLLMREMVLVGLIDQILETARTGLVYSIKRFQALTY